jgi:hypothetical protein
MYTYTHMRRREGGMEKEKREGRREHYCISGSSEEIKEDKEEKRMTESE